VVRRGKAEASGAGVCAFLPFRGVHGFRRSGAGETQIWHPKVLDLYLFSFDARLHVQLAFIVGQTYAMWPWFKAIGVALYIALPIPMAMVYRGHLMREREKA